MDRRLYSSFQPATANPKRGGPCNSRSFIGHPHTHMLPLVALLKNWVPSSWVRSLLDNLGSLNLWPAILHSSQL